MTAICYAANVSLKAIGHTTPLINKYPKIRLFVAMQLLTVHLPKPDAHIAVERLPAEDVRLEEEPRANRPGSSARRERGEGKGR